MKWKTHINQILFFAVVTITSFLYWQQTKNNHIQTYTDSAIYLELADNIKKGNGYRIFLNGELHDYSFHPPLYPALIVSLSEVLNVDTLTSARILAGFFLIITLWGFFMVFEYLKMDPLIRMVAYFIFIFSWVGELYHTVLSEQLFNIWMLFSILLAWQYARNKSIYILILLGILLGLSTLTRYATFGIFPAFLLWVFYLSEKKFKPVLSFVLTFLFILLPWFFYSVIFTGTAFERKIAFHPPAAEHFKQWLITTVNWLTPGWTYILFFPAFFILLFIFRKSSVQRDKYLLLNPRKNNSPIQLLLWMAVSYLVFIFLSITFIDFDTPLDTRIMAPLYIILLISGTYFIQRYYYKNRRLITVFLSIILISHLVDYSIKAQERFLSVQKNKGWAEREIIRTLKTMHPEKIWSNATDIIKANTEYDGITYEIPVKFNRTSLKPNPNYKNEMQQLKSEIRNGKSILVFFTHLNPRKFQPDETEILNFFKDFEVTHFKDGLIITRNEKNKDE